MPIVLLGDAAVFDGLVDKYEVTVRPPAIDEHTLGRWFAPELGSVDQIVDAFRNALRAAIADLIAARDPDPDEQGKPATLGFDDANYVRDPAARALGVRLIKIGVDGAESDVFLPDSYWRYPAAPDLSSRDIVLSCTPESPIDPKKTDVGLSFSLALGTCLAIEIWPLVSTTEYAARFNARAMSELIDLDAPPQFAIDGFTPFKSTTVVFERATADLPKPEELRNGVSLLEQADGSVALSFKARSSECGELAFVRSYRIRRQRWVWRNRPIIVGDSGACAGEKLRLLASGLPADAYSDKSTGVDYVRDSSTAVKTWENMAELDGGFIDRSKFEAVWPKNKDHPAMNLRETLLMQDDRDGSRAGEFLRYMLSVTSRYAGAFRDGKNVTSEPPSDWRRIAVCYRGAELAVPKVLSIVPLTAHIDPPIASGTRSKATPFQVLVDGAWFREYGIGERLQVRLVLENLDTGEADEIEQGHAINKGRPYRIGRLPDHYLSRGASSPVTAETDPYGRAAYFRELLTTAAEDERQPLQLPAFGPFGFSLDVSPDQALANASAFIVYSPDDVGPHWSMFLNFRRALHFPKSHSGRNRYSDPTGTHAVYTLADIENLVADMTLQSAVHVSSSLAELRLQHMSWTLDPIGDEIASTARSQYRYFFLLTRLHAAAGTSVDIEVPIAMWRLARSDDSVRFRHGDSVPAELLQGSGAMVSGGRYNGRILEVRVNGDYPDGVSRLDAALPTMPGESPGPLTIARELMTRFWNLLLYLRPDGSSTPDETDWDAAGMMTRLSRPLPTKAT